MERSDKIKENTAKLIKFVAEKFEADELDNTSLVELFQDIGMYLNLKTIPEYARENGLTYQGVKSCRNVQEIFGVRFVVENE